MDDGDDGLSARQLRTVLALLLATVAVVGALDLLLDRPTGWLSAHVLVELTMMTVSAGTALWLARGWGRTRERLAGTRRTLAERESERDAWRARAEQALAGLSRALEEQFAAWGLTPAERDVALRLLKGDGHKQIAAATGRSERTVRQHAVAVYDKSGLGGRAELAAFFLEGLGAPRD